MTSQAPALPRWITVPARMAEILCDGSLVAAAWLARNGAPLSVHTALGPREWTWLLLLAAGGLFSGAGTLLGWLGLKLCGCTLTAGGLAIWIISLLAGHNITSGQSCLMAVLGAAIGLVMYRAVVACASLYLRAERSRSVS